MFDVAQEAINMLLLQEQMRAVVSTPSFYLQSSRRKPVFSYNLCHGVLLTVLYCYLFQAT